MPAKSVARIAGSKGHGQAQNVVSGSVKLSIRPPIEATRDWALVRLAAPVCKGRTLTIAPRSVNEIKALAETGRVYQVAYHHDLPSMKLAKGGPCWMRRGETPSDRAAMTRDFADTRDLLLHSCDTGAASSGSPLLVDGPGGPEVVGINVGTYVRAKILMQNGDVVHRYKSDTIANTAVGVEAFLPALGAFSAAEILVGRTEIKLLQDLLEREGHYRGPRDGVYGPALRAAIGSFEKAQRRPETGLASAALLERLIALHGATPPVAEEGAAIATGSVAPRKATKK
jgi:protease YdgD